MSDHESRTSVIAALLANVGIAIAKFVGFLFTQSSSMLAESIHSMADSGNQALMLFGGYRARRDADQRHPFGYARERYFWAFVVSIVLFLLGGLFSLFEGEEKLRTPHEVESPIWAIVILLVAIVLEGLSFRTAVHQALPLKGEASWWSFIRRTKNPELPVVLLEDSAALVGLVFALAAVSLSAVTGNSTYDAIGSLAIGSLLVVIAITLAIEMKSLLIGESASKQDEQKIIDAVQSCGKVSRLINIRTEHLGPNELLVALKVEFDRSLVFDELVDAVNEVEVRVREAVPAARQLFVEPDLHRPELAGQ